MTKIAKRPSGTTRALDQLRRGMARVETTTPKSSEIVLPTIIDLNDDPSTSSGLARDETQMPPFGTPCGRRAGWGEWNKGEKRPLLYVEEI